MGIWWLIMLFYFIFIMFEFFNLLLFVQYPQPWELALKPGRITWAGAQDDRPMSSSVTWRTLIPSCPFKKH